MAKNKGDEKQVKTRMKTIYRFTRISKEVAIHGVRRTPPKTGTATATLPMILVFSVQSVYKA